MDVSPEEEWKLGRPLPPSQLKEAIRHLRSDPKLAEVIDDVGELRLVSDFRPFEALVVGIVFQQLGGASARAILKRLKHLYGGRIPTPRRLLRTPDEELLSTGLSRRKVVSLKDLAKRLEGGSLDLERLSHLPDEEVLKVLDEVKGIGRWTAQMFLIFPLCRMDVLPAGDLGLRAAIRRAYGLKELPSEREVERIAERWHPYCTIASLYLWRYQDVRPPAERGRRVP